MWLILKQRLRTQDCLRSWEVNSDLAVVCPLCETQPESHEHLFFDYPFSQQVWSRVQQIAGLTGAGPSLASIITHLLPIAKRKSSKSCIERRDEKKRLDHLKQDQTMLVIKRFSKRKKVFRERNKTGKIHAKRVFMFETLIVRDIKENWVLLEVGIQLEVNDCLLEVTSLVMLMLLLFEYGFGYHDQFSAGMMVVKKIEDELLEEIKVSHFGVHVLRFYTCFIDIFGFLEKFGWWFEQDIDVESEDDNEKKLVMVNEEGWMS
nr:hypothetical protein [Tanacetum cinerariifolium]